MNRDFSSSEKSAEQLSDKAKPGPSNFEIASRQLSQEKDMPSWLPGFFKRWTGSILLDRHVMTGQPRRKDVREALEGLLSAADDLERLLNDGQLREFLEDPPHGPLERRDGILTDLANLKDRADTAIGRLVTPEGKTLPGRSRAQPQRAFSSKGFCALIIIEAWKFIHGDYPAPTNGAAAAAADTLWKSSPHPLLQPPAEATGWGADSVTGWRPYLKAARDIGFDDMRAELQRHLFEEDRHAKLE